MNFAKSYDANPMQTTMRSATYRTNIYPYRYPFTMIDEEFRQLSKFLPMYRDYFWVSNYGKVYNANNGYLCSPYVNDQGYTLVAIRRVDGGSDQIGVHILVCTCFNGPKPSPKHQVNHKDCFRSNNYYENLEWVTPQENLQHSRDMGNYWHGNVYSSAKYSEEQVRFICELLQSGITDPQELSMRVFGCPPTPGIYSLFRTIRDGSHWNTVTKDYNIPELENRNFTPDHIIHAMCRFMQNNPEIAYTADLGTILSSEGISLDGIDEVSWHRYRSALHQLRHKNAYKRIARQYILPSASYTYTLAV